MAASIRGSQSRYAPGLHSRALVSWAKTDSDVSTQHSSAARSASATASTNLRDRFPVIDACGA